ncbi:uncharacterized protein LOC118348036 [Juglans regia]|uniref:Uncharacterized protein LOC118348036 n=1 Tax=Juglans regia TaxID=51240 RepID=A0A6P9EB67_JUGRE|nr:uncharacterized protein LOC118348036 [Juglans regia]
MSEISSRASEWAIDIIKYLNANELPEDMWKVKKIKNKPTRFILTDKTLYKRGYSVPLLSSDINPPGHQQSNMQVEATNKTLLRILKKKLDDKKRTWAEELPRVLWTYRTTIRTSTGETHFALTYGHETVDSIGMPTHKIQQFDQDSNGARLEEEQDLLEERRLEAEVRTTINKKRAKRCFNKRVRLRSFKVKDLMLKQVGITTRDEGKLGPRWESPYVVIANNRQGLYRLKDEQGRDLPHPRNAEHLQKFFC